MWTQHEFNRIKWREDCTGLLRPPMIGLLASDRLTDFTDIAYLLIASETKDGQLKVYFIFSNYCAYGADLDLKALACNHIGHRMRALEREKPISIEQK
uniref:SWIM-type domain-containing protein n=1 Tax=Heterorhabditis bacteriophora TaxID=37862 RepID=A0A1I7XRK4_HETBA